MPSLGLGLGLHRANRALFRGLLDQYGGAAAAYSLRALSSGWLAGDVVEVRRDADGATGIIHKSFTEGEINSGVMLAWVTEFSGTANGFVSTWYDQSGFANDATQGTTTSQPKIVDAGALVVNANGDNSLLFDNTDDFLSANAVAASFSGTSMPASTFAVIEVTGAGNSALYSLGNSSTGTQFQEPMLADGTYYEYFFRDDAAAIKSGSNISTYAGVDLASSISSGTALDYLINGSNIVTAADITLGSTTLNRFTIGALGRDLDSNFFGGYVVEMIVYPSDQTSNRVAIEANINDAYTIY